MNIAKEFLYFMIFMLFTAIVVNQLPPIHQLIPINTPIGVISFSIASIIKIFGTITLAILLFFYIKSRDPILLLLSLVVGLVTFKWF